MAANVYNILYGLTAIGVFSFIPLYAVSVYNMSILRSGFVMTSRSVGIMLASTVTSVFLVRWGYRRPILVGTGMAIVGLFLLSLDLQGVGVAGISLNATALFMIVLGVTGIAHGIATPASNNACIELMPEKVATITGLRAMFRQLGSVIGIALGTVLIHNVTDARKAFFILFLAASALLLVSIPAVFAIPASPCPPSVNNSQIKKPAPGSNRGQISKP
jgi:MFS family permease